MVNHRMLGRNSVALRPRASADCRIGVNVWARRLTKTSAHKLAMIMNFRSRSYASDVDTAGN